VLEWQLQSVGTGVVWLELLDVGEHEAEASLLIGRGRSTKPMESSFSVVLDWMWMEC